MTDSSPISVPASSCGAGRERQALPDPLPTAGPSAAKPPFLLALGSLPNPGDSGRPSGRPVAPAGCRAAALLQFGVTLGSRSLSI